MQWSKHRNLLPFVLYIGAIVFANWLVTRYGQAALPFTAFFLIPFDLIIRDLLQDRWQGKNLRFRMAVLILSGGVLSVVTATGSLRVNIASMVAFLIAGTCDALTYQWMIRYGRIFRINAATILAAVSDSIVFALIAFSSVSWALVGAQAATKIAGGFCWSLVMFRFFQRAPRPGYSRGSCEGCGALETYPHHPHCPKLAERRYRFERHPPKGYSLEDFE